LIEPSRPKAGNRLKPAHPSVVVTSLDRRINRATVGGFENVWQRVMQSS
jgi:hypothetical protein